MAKETWFRPNHDVCGFFPATPGSVLANHIKKVVVEEGGTEDQHEDKDCRDRGPELISQQVYLKTMVIPPFFLNFKL